MSDILSQLKKLKNDPRTGAVSVEAHEAAKARLLFVISADLPDEAASQPSFTSWFLGSFISKPVTAMVTAIIVAAGGLTTVSAATDSLPGETLYSVKRVTEQAQIQLASLDRRAVLHTEFAGRRLEEATKLRESGPDHPEHANLARTAFNEYEQELNRASDDLRQLKNEAATSQTFAVVNSVQEKLAALETTIDASVASSQTAEAGEEALAAREAAVQTEQVATNVAVEVHEEEGSVASTQEMKDMFKKSLGAIEARRTFNAHRIEVIRSSLQKQPERFAQVEDVPTEVDLKRMGLAINQTDLQIAEAMNGFAAGGYRTAFQVLQGIDAELLALEADLARVEILIMATLSAPEEEVTPEEETVDPLLVSPAGE